MDLENQQRVKDAAEKYGAENVVVILGSSDPEGAEIYVIARKKLFCAQKRMSRS